MTSELVDVPEIVTVPPRFIDEIGEITTCDAIRFADADTGASVVLANAMERAIDEHRISFNGFTMFISSLS
jgi:hypothetical protein